MKITQSRFFCTQCGKEGLPVNRKQSKQREPGHLKKLYCLYCGEEVNHAEIREIGGYTIEDFQKEYQLGRFAGGLKKEINQLLTCSKKTCPFNVDGKCWNTNCSNRCAHRIYKEVDVECVKQ